MFVTGWNADRGTSVVNVFQPNVNGFYQHVAILVAKGGYDVGAHISVSGRGVRTGGPRLSPGAGGVTA